MIGYITMEKKANDFMINATIVMGAPSKSLTGCSSLTPQVRGAGCRSV
jgi:hypothetical protein